MNFFLVGSFLLLLLFYINVIDAAAAAAVAVSDGSKTSTTKNSSSLKLTSLKETEKFPYPKKVSSLKKGHAKSSRKKMSDITDKFRDLPDDDLAFIKELDKQFRLHGGKVKIKVENKNVTETKNSKRTIDNELGYGYAHNGYHYDPPKFMFYPYSQQDISSNAPGYFPLGDGKTEVSIEPSYSYELKSQTYVTQTEPQIDVPKAEQPQAHGQIQQHYEEPVIVLRIPGPAKYATHLQTLLQKYLEIRAAQYLHILEEAEHGNLQPQQQLQQLDYGQAPHAHIEQQQQQQQHVQAAPPDHHDYAQQVEYSQPHAGSPQAEQYPEIDHVYHSYKNRYSGQQQGQAHTAVHQPESYYTNQQSAEEQHQPQYDEHHYSPPEHFQYQQQPQFYYTHQQQYAQPEGPPASSYHQVLLVAMTQPQQADSALQQNHDESAEEPQQQQQQPIYAQDHKESAVTVPIAENNPRHTHTKVVFTNRNEHPSHDYQMYRLPSIKPHERHAPTSTPDFHQDFHHQSESLSHYHPQQQQPYAAAVETADAGAHGHAQVVAITQRPYNYHAHNVKATRTRGRTPHARRAVTAKEADNGLQKIREYVRDKLGAETGSAVEFKTTQLVDA